VQNRDGPSGNGDEIGTVRIEVHFAWLVEPIAVQIVPPVLIGLCAVLVEGVLSVLVVDGAVVPAVRRLCHVLAVASEVNRDADARSNFGPYRKVDTGECAAVAKRSEYFRLLRCKGGVAIQP